MFRCHGRQMIAIAAFFLQATPGKCEGPVVTIPADELGAKYQLLGKIGKPMGTVVTVQGMVVAGFPKGYDDGPNVLMQRIDGVATQASDPIQLTRWLYDFGDPVSDGHGLPKLQYGAAYQFEGFETGEFVGQPHEVYERTRIPVQTSAFHFHHQFKVFRAKRIEPIAFSPGDFVDRMALIQGTARTIQGKSWIEGKGWRLLTGDGRWQPWIEGKPAEALGRMKKSNVAGEFRLEGGSSHLSRLEDQVGHQVELRGIARELNEVWSFDYRGTTILVENMKRLPGWSGELWGSPVLIRGRLEKAMLPENWDTGGSDRSKLKEQLVIRDASWAKASPLLSLEVEYNADVPIEGGPAPSPYK